MLLHWKPVSILLSLAKGERYASMIAKEVDCTYTHVLKILEKLESCGIVEFEKKGRIKKVRLTPLGQDLAHNLEGVVRVLERAKEGSA